MNNDDSFSIMGKKGLFAMKSHVIHKRTKSRDIFDLFSFLKDGRTIDEIFDYGKNADDTISIETAKAVLTGIIPLDEDDEGLMSVGETTPVSEIYDFFTSKVNAYEIGIAAKVKSEFAGDDAEESLMGL